MLSIDELRAELERINYKPRLATIHLARST
jgi:hypothetical protein